MFRTRFLPLFLLDNTFSSVMAESRVGGRVYGQCCYHIVLSENTFRFPGGGDVAQQGTA
jgi:hypothetical protein